MSSFRFCDKEDGPPHVKELRAELAQIQKDHDARCHNCHVGYEPIPTSPRLLLLFLDVVERAIRHDDTTQGREATLLLVPAFNIAAAALEALAERP